MRSEQEMMDLIIKTAAEDERIRAAYLEGSRVNPKAPRDSFQDYDVVYIVTETESFQKDRGWIDRFGKRLYMQYPEDGVYYPSDRKNCYGWLMQFEDGNRLDLHVCTKEYALARLEMYRTLADKDGVMPEKEMTSDERYWIKKPTDEEFLCTCNEFWWCMNNVAKGLWREELPYAMEMIDFAVRPMLRRMMEWKIGKEQDFSVSAGKSGKYMKHFLSETVYQRYLSTYACAETDKVWAAVFRMCDLFQETAVEVSQALAFSYDYEEAENSRGYLERVKDTARRNQKEKNR